MSRDDLPHLLYDTVKELGGSASIVDICKEFWHQNEDQLRQSGNLFYTWQYDIRWAATALRKAGKMKSADFSEKGIWEII